MMLSLRFLIPGLCLILVPLVSVAQKTSKDGTATPKTVESIDVKLEFTYNNFEFPIRIYQILDSSKIKSAKVNVSRDRKDLPFGTEYTGRSVKVRKGGVQSVAIAIENTTEKAVFFFAAPHDTVPSENSLGNKFSCFCYGQVYRVPPKSTFYRIATIQTIENSLGNEVIFRHKIVGISPEKLLQMKEAGVHQN